MVLQSDPGRLLTVLEYVRYRLSADVQARAIGIMSLLAARMPGLPDLLLQADEHGAHARTHSYAVSKLSSCLPPSQRVAQVMCQHAS